MFRFKVPIFDIDKLPIISEILIYRLSIIFHRYIVHPYLQSLISKEKNMDSLNMTFNSLNSLLSELIRHDLCFKVFSLSSTSLPNLRRKLKMISQKKMTLLRKLSTLRLNLRTRKSPSEDQYQSASYVKRSFKTEQ